MDVGASANLEVVDKFCYLGDMLTMDRDADAAVEARIRIGWNKFRQLVPLLTNRDISLIRRGRLLDYIFTFLSLSHHCKALNSLICGDVLLRNFSLTHLPDEIK